MIDVDPFELPDWLGTDPVVWHSCDTVRGGHLVRGELRGEDGTVGCDLFAVDQAWPAPVADDTLRREVHTAWRSGEIVLRSDADRLLLLAPGTDFGAVDVIELLRRFSRTVGARAEHYTAALRLDVWGEQRGGGRR